MLAPTHLCTALTRRSLLRSVPLLAAVGLVGGGCARAGDLLDHQDHSLEEIPSQALPKQVTVALEDNDGAAGRATSAMSARLLAARLQAAPSQNALLSPVGVSLVLALLYAQAPEPGTGVVQLLGAHHEGQPLPAEQRDNMWRQVQLALQRFDTADLEALKSFDPKSLPDKPLVHVASNLVLVGDEPGVRQEYVDAARTWYDSAVSKVGHKHAQAALDKWARLHTGGLVPKSGVQVSSETRVVLQNALLLAARWQAPFDHSSTEEGMPFTLAGGGQSKADYMRTKDFFKLARGQGWRALRLPYGSSNARPAKTPGLALDVVLPDEPVSPASLEEGAWAAATAALSQASTQDEAREVVLRLPRLDLGTGVGDVLAELKQMGVALDHLGHIGDGLEVDSLLQQARLLVDEEGTVGAALTEAGIAMAAPAEPSEPEEFLVDHPYVLRVVDTATQVPVLEAAVMDPASKQAV